MAQPTAATPAPSTPTHLGPFSTSNVSPTPPNSIASSTNVSHHPDSQGSRSLRQGLLNKADHPINLPNLTSIASAGLRTSPSPKPQKLASSPRFSSKPLTGLATISDDRRRREENERLEAQKQSLNPASNALGTLLGRPDSSMSKPQDAPPAAVSTTSEPLATMANSISTSEPTPAGDDAQNTSSSVSRISTAENSTIAAITTPATSISGSNANADALATTSSGSKSPNPASTFPAASEDRSNKALSFPPPVSETSMGNSDARNPMRGMSLPMPGFGQNGIRSDSAKKHRCPYCSTDFTRHHNLKSHLLTHSHEKPYACQTCQVRFRRLHDLKRHTKLHTGERPHVCPKCNRRFARGDALARHNKGQGGCAGRRASMGSFGGDDDFNEGSQTGHDTMQGTGVDESMDGLLYTGDGGGDVDRMDEDGELADERRRMSLPSIKAHDAPSTSHRSDSASQNTYQHHSSTYPPVAARAPGQSSSGLLPPGHGSGMWSRTSTSPSTQARTLSPKTAGSGTSGPSTAGPPSMFSGGGMTESPKPLSPHGLTSHQLGHPDNATMHRNRSPSLTQQFQQQHFGRHGTTRSPPPMGLPPPMGGPGNANAPQLPSLPGLGPPESRLSLHSQSAERIGGVLPGQAAPSIASGTSGGGSTSSHGQGSAESSRNIFAGADIWGYVRSLEERLSRLQEEVTSLKGQVASQNR
ncbi:MAG: hypothetical protein M1819_002299 [Sarea resinae]|nr:MAG: hypothetical protein M1819_002299 [Sarea resinae]